MEAVGEAVVTSTVDGVMSQMAVWAAVGVVAGALLSVLLYGWTKEAAKRGIALSAVCALLVLSFRSNWQVRTDVGDLKEKFDRIDWNTSCLSKPRVFESKVFGAVAQEFYAAGDEKCSQIARGELELTPEEVKQAWLSILAKGQDTFFATNTIAPDDWPALSCEKQRTAGVETIRRVMILRRDEPDFNGVLEGLGRRQLRECGVDGVLTYFKDELYENFPREIAVLGQIDIVLVDNSALLITAYDERDKTIRQGLLTTDSAKVTTARQMFGELFRIARPLK